MRVRKTGVLFGLVVFVNLPQIVATIVIFALERGADADVCDAGARARRVSRRAKRETARFTQCVAARRGETQVVKKLTASLFGVLFPGGACGEPRTRFGCWLRPWWLVCGGGSTRTRGKTRRNSLWRGNAPWLSSPTRATRWTVSR